MLLPKKGNAPSTIDVQRKQLPIYQAKSQLIDQLRQLHNAVLIGKSFHYIEVMLSSPSMQVVHRKQQYLIRALISSLLQKLQQPLKSTAGSLMLEI